jgi:dienelactone hydrolase
MTVHGVAAGVPFVATPARTAGAPVVVAWHLLDAPRTPAAFAAALPLDGLDAWKIYFGLPMSGSRAPAGGMEELWRLLGDDAVMNVHRHVALGAIAEFPAAFAAVRERLGFPADAPVGVVGGSMGGAVAQLAVAEAAGVDVRAAVLINPVVRLRALIDTMSAEFGDPYVWRPAADAVAERVDFVRRAGELTGASLRYVTGADDDVDAIIDPVAAVVAALSERQAQVDWQVVPGMGHALAEEPGVEPAPQTPHAAQVDLLAVDWFRKHLG